MSVEVEGQHALDDVQAKTLCGNFSLPIPLSSTSALLPARMPPAMLVDVPEIRERIRHNHIQEILRDDQLPLVRLRHKSGAHAGL